MTELSKKAREYAQVTKQIKLLEQQKEELRNTLLETMGSTKTLVEDGIKVTTVTRSVKDLPFEAFQDILAKDGAEVLYSICKVVQTRLSATDKQKLVVTGFQHPSIRVSGDI